MAKQIECPFCGSKVVGDAGDTDHHNIYKCWDCDSLFEQNNKPYECANCGKRRPGMKDYRIITRKRRGEDWKTMVIVAPEYTGPDGTDWKDVAEYRLTPGKEKSEIATMRRSINRHLDNGGTMGNYQF